MIKVTVLYPNDEGSKFDIDYYCKKHIPMVQQKVGPALKSVDVEQGISGGAPGSRPPYAAACHLYFESVPAFQQAFGPHSKEIMADVPNYTDVQPLVQISEIKM